MVVMLDVRSALHFAAAMCYLNPIHVRNPNENGRRSRDRRQLVYTTVSSPRLATLRPVSFSCEALKKKAEAEAPAKAKEKPSICTADELHYVSVPGTGWNLALWRYLPPPTAPTKNHPLLLLSGVGTNAIAYDLAPGSSFARCMSNQGFDTWILEVRGAGLSTREGDFKAIERSADIATSELVKSINKSINGVISADETPINAIASPQSETSIEVNKTEAEILNDESLLVTKLTETLLRLVERVSGFLNEGQSRIMSAKFVDEISQLFEDAQLSERFNEIRKKLSGLLEARQNSAMANQIKDLSQRIVSTIEEGQRSVSPQFVDLRERLSRTIEDFQKQLDLIVMYDWDFDNYLEEDVPAAVRWNT